MLRFAIITGTLALKSLRRNIMRSGLTTLGIIIGVSAVIAMVEIGQGSSKSVQKTIASMGANNLVIFPGAAYVGGSGVRTGSGSATTLTPGDADAILDRCRPYVTDAAPAVRARTQLVFGNKNYEPNYIYGTTPAFLQVRDWDLMEGQCFTDQDVRNSAQVCVLGATVVRELFDSEDPINKEIRVNNKPFKVIGVLTRKGANMMGYDQDDVLLAPWKAIKDKVVGQGLANVNQSAAVLPLDPSQKVNTVSQLYPSQQVLYPQPSALQQADTPLPVRFTNVDQILVKAGRAEDIPVAMRMISEVLRERHRITGAQTDDFYVRDMTEMSKALGSATNRMGSFLLAVALISLIVGGVGIMNIMLVSVTERTREIGLRMAVGARARDILLQFLVESVLLSLLGGFIGVLLGRGSSILLRKTLHWPTELSIPAIVAAVLVSAMVGIVFGYYPAWKASRLDPIEALRYE
ncbi:MAG: ABC transporter permease [Gemmataceae bacterium]|nr:ABC transporter permease [Gemmataceae bacterium]